MTVAIACKAETRPYLARMICFAVGMFFAGVIPYEPVSADPTDARQLKKGVFLVATQQLTGSMFERTVVVMTDYDDGGAIGLIINRPTTFELGRRLPELASVADNAAMLHFGGPVVPQAVFLLTRTPREHGTEHRIIADVSLAAGRTALIHILSNASPDDSVRAYSGYSAWVPGQLEVEISRGDWLAIQADTAIIFAAAPRKLWVDLIKRWSGQWT
ncbi:MAG: hypothetical protein FD165_1597 [Gammaproteobacteria bacterium]|nr:MAG: hypothetical protein FD165_1597 [Gammaproteobacteria bacterium]TND05508.1 MAG: hypothetical protein FD120_1116 [Gammaproteobacteria bacterium]